MRSASTQSPLSPFSGSWAQAVTLPAIEITIPESAAFVHLHTPEVMADVIVDPGRPWRAHAIIHLSHEDGIEFPTNNGRFAIDPPNATAPAAARSAKRMPDRQRIVGIKLSRASVWTVGIIAGPGGPSPIFLNGPFVIER